MGMGFAFKAAEAFCSSCCADKAVTRCWILDAGDTGYWMKAV